MYKTIAATECRVCAFGIGLRIPYGVVYFFLPGNQYVCRHHEAVLGVGSSFFMVWCAGGAIISYWEVRGICCCAVRHKVQVCRQGHAEKE